MDFKVPKVMKIKFILILTLMLCAQSALSADIFRHRAEQSDSTQILFIGNSYTYYNHLPELVRDLAASIDKKIAPSYSLKGGESIQGHLKTDYLLKTIADGGFDYAVIQEASYTPSYPTRYVVENVYPYAHKLDSLVRTGSPNVKIIYYMTWGHKNGIVHHQTDYPLNKTYQGMQDRITLTYLEMAQENGGLCAPVGMAWEKVVNERPDIELYAKDNYHPSLEGSYLAACTILSTILGEPIHSTYYAGLPQATALYLQKVAGDVVAANRHLLGL